MRLTLEVPVCPDGPRSFLVEPGREVRVGRDSSAEIALPWDRTLSRRHFALTFDGTTCRLRDLESTQGTLVNDAPVTLATLSDGDEILAGGTLLRVRLREPIGVGPPASAAVSASTAPERPPLSPLHARVLETLRGQPGNLFAVLDAARDPAVLGFLMGSGVLFQSLYESPAAMEHASVSPYLAALPRDSAFLETLVREGWGKSWGIYLASAASFEEVRKHLRRFLTVELEGGRKVLFRFYDPRVLRVFIPTCTADEMREFSGPIEESLFEDEDPRVMLEYRTSGGLGPIALPLDRVTR